MGSLESGIPAKRDNGGRGGRQQQHQFLQRNRSRLSRFLLWKRIDYFQWICTIGVFFFFAVLFQMFLPGLVIDKSDKPWSSKEILPPDLIVFKEKGFLDFGDDVRFEPTKLLMKFQREANGFNFTSSSLNTTLQRFGFRKPKLAMVFADLLADPEQVLMLYISKAQQEISYAIERLPMQFSRENGLNKPGKIYLLGKDGSKWMANLLLESRGRMTLGDGWKSFVKANSLKTEEKEDKKKMKKKV